ncbi:AAA family ATPase [Rhizobacter sp. Root1221]|uniref:AAA family ATPase n=1 Tax=Rhizobacter sp. Root1221 TaxID=1736433 RepID=UPI0006F5698D|nr:AAA family ATPase [Rhizobacter sp. Root1221]KQW02657.1 AAA family ATPase [Rhizobacter sp. Root1221]
MTPSLHDAARQVRQGIRAATDGLVGRDQLAELIVLAAVAGEHLLVIGPPGTAKSAVVRRVAQSMGGRYFEYLLGRFTEPSELFGPVDLRKLREGTVETDVTGMLPEADVAFLDEVFLGSTAILNTLLGLLNERRFRRGHTQIDCPLRVAVGAANGLPEDEALAAFADRFLLHLFIEPVPDHHLEAMLDGGWRADTAPVTAAASLSHLDVLCRAVRQVDMAGARPGLADCIRQLRRAGVHLSDRRIVKSQRLIAAAAVLAGRTEATPADLWPLLYVLPTKESQLSARDVLKEPLAHATHPNLFSAVEEAAMQPMSRVGRLVETALVCLARQDAGRQAEAEGLLREIDANFHADVLPADLAVCRKKLAALVALPV